MTQLDRELDAWCQFDNDEVRITTLDLSSTSGNFRVYDLTNDERELNNLYITEGTNSDTVNDLVTMAKNLIVEYQSHILYNKWSDCLSGQLDMAYPENSGAIAWGPF